MNINDIARLAGVSITTVSRVINNKRPVKEESRVRILKIIASCGFRPDPSAQELARRKNCTAKKSLDEL